MSQALLLYLAGLTLRTAIVGSLGGLVSLFVRSVAVRHAVWVAVVVVSMLLPVADAVLPAALVPAPVQQLPSLAFLEPVVPPAVPARSTSESDESPVNDNVGVWKAAAILYVVVSLALLGRLAWAYRRISLLKRTSRVVTVPEIRTVAVAHRLVLVPDVRVSESLLVPLTVGFFDPSVIVPADWEEWDQWKLHAVLSHELAHIRRADWALRVIASLHRCVFWFNPFSWWMERHLSNLSEKASDEASLAITGDAVRYAEVLLQFAAAAQMGRRFHFEGVAMAKKNMRSRIERVLALRRPGMGIVSKSGWIAVLAMAMPVLYSAAAVHVVPETFITPPMMLMAAIQPAPVMALEPVVEGAVAPAIVVEEKPSPAPVQAAPVKVPGAEMQAKLVSRVKPVYPPLAKQARIQGVVILGVIIGVDGRVSDVQVINGHPLLQQAAIDSVSQWVYQPQAAPVATMVTINFAFQERPADGEMTLTPPPGPTEVPGRVRVRLTPVTQVPPKYPEEARALKLQGIVILEVLVGTEGTVKEVKVVNGHPVFQQAAIDAVRQWKFAVPMLTGDDKEAVSAVTVNFQLRDGSNTASSTTRGALGPVPGATVPQAGSLIVKNSSGSTFPMPLVSLLRACMDCMVVIGNNGSSISNLAPGRPVPANADFSVRLVGDGKDLEFTCHAQECSVSSVLATGATFVQSIANGKSGVVSASAVITVGVSR